MAAISSGNKNRLRKSALTERLNLNEEFIESNSIKISNHLFKNFSLLKKNIHLFYPITKNKEVNTWHIHKTINSNSAIFTSFYEKSKDKWECISFNPSNTPVVKANTRTNTNKIAGLNNHRYQ